MASIPRSYEKLNVQTKRLLIETIVEQPPQFTRMSVRTRRTTREFGHFKTNNVAESSRALLPKAKAVWCDAHEVRRSADFPNVMGDERVVLFSGRRADRPGRRQA